LVKLLTLKGNIVAIVSRKCEKCKKPFDTLSSEIKRGYGRFCSRECSAQRPRLKNRKRVKVICSRCKKKFEKKLSSLNRSKSGLYFCTRRCKDLAQRIIGGIKDIQPSHYGITNTNYRAIAFRHLPHRCNSCNFDEIVELLQVHHKDCNRENNRISNLEILCPTCHEKYHFLTKTGKWAKK
jgi:endogenous inhibitor of DNA gyrase (YacG/DUF329 family)